MSRARRDEAGMMAGMRMETVAVTAPSRSIEPSKLTVMSPSVMP